MGVDLGICGFASCACVCACACVCTVRLKIKKQPKERLEEDNRTLKIQLSGKEEENKQLKSEIARLMTDLQNLTQVVACNIYTYI
jgi:hypothetical protein